MRKTGNNTEMFLFYPVHHVILSDKSLNPVSTKKYFVE